MNTFSELIKKTRLKLRMDIKDVSENSGVAFSVISRLENNLSQPTVVTVVKLAYALRLQSFELCGSLGLDSYLCLLRDHDVREFNPNVINIYDIESFLDFFHSASMKAKDFLYDSYEEVERKLRPESLLEEDEEKDDEIVSVWDTVKNAIIPLSNRYIPLPYPDKIDLQYLTDIHNNHGVMIFQDLGYMIRERRIIARLSLRDLAALTNVSANSISRLERGVIDRLFLNEIVQIDNALHSQGQIFSVCWAAGEFHSGVLRNRVHDIEVDPPLSWTEQEHAIATTLVKLDRWHSSIGNGDRFVQEFRNRV